MEKETPRRRFPLKWIVGLLLLAGMALLATTAGGLFYATYSQIAREGGGLWDTFQFLARPQQYVFGKQDRINILCLGVDYNHDSKGIQYSKGARSDTMIVLSLDGATHRVTGLSIPRDLRVPISADHGHDKINSAFAVGGARASRRVVQQLLGVPIHYCLVVRVEAAKELVDALGGLNVNVEKDMDYDDSWGNLHIHLKKGKQLLNGMQVVGYCRFRHDAESDFGRMRRQQQVIRVVSQRLTQSISPQTLEKLVQIFKTNVTSDLPYSKMLTLARLFRGLDRTQVKIQSFRVVDDPSGTFDLLPVPEENRRQVKEVFSQ